MADLDSFEPPAERLRHITPKSYRVDDERTSPRNRGECAFTTESPVSMETPSREEIEASKTAAGGWTRQTLARWGVPWPPPKGWRAKLERKESK